MSITDDFSPDFFVVGAPKAGTTAVFNWLKTHPDIFLPEVKEPGYFAYAGRSAVPPDGPYDPDYHARISVNIGDYAQLYADANGRLTGDVSPVYLVDKSVAARIASVRPDARIIVILRDPVERAFSQYLHHVRDGLEPAASFETALNDEPARLSSGWSWGHGYATHGHYAAQIDQYLKAFARDQILFLEFKQLNVDPAACWRRICAHLGILETPLKQNDRVNVTSALANVSNRPTVTRAIRHPGPLQSLFKPLLPQTMRKHIRNWLEGQGKPLPVLQANERERLAAQFNCELEHIAKQTGLCLNHWTRAL